MKAEKWAKLQGKTIESLDFKANKKLTVQISNLTIEISSQNIPKNHEISR